MSGGGGGEGRRGQKTRQGAGFGLGGHYFDRARTFTGCHSRSITRRRSGRKEKKVMRRG